MYIYIHTHVYTHVSESVQSYSKQSELDGRDARSSSFPPPFAPTEASRSNVCVCVCVGVCVWSIWTCDDDDDNVTNGSSVESDARRRAINTLPRKAAPSVCVCCVTYWMCYV